MTTDTTADTNWKPGTILVTGANSGLGLEVAAQLAAAGATRVLVGARSQAKANDAITALESRTGRSIFEPFVADVSDRESSVGAAAELVAAGHRFDGLILNAGMVPTSHATTADGLDVCFASTILGHHIITTALLEADLLAPGARVLAVSSEAANNDLPAATGMRPPGFMIEAPVDDATFGQQLADLARGEAGSKGYDGRVQYAGTKLLAAWWAGAMQRRHEGRYDFVAVSPGAVASTNASRHLTGAMKIMAGFMNRFGHLVGMNQPIAQGANRYLDVLRDSSRFVGGAFYASPPKKMTGALVERDATHLTDPRRQDLGLGAIEALVATS